MNLPCCLFQRRKIIRWIFDFFISPLFIGKKTKKVKTCKGKMSFLFRFFFHEILKSFSHSQSLFIDNFFVITVFVNGLPVFCVKTIKNEKVNWFIFFLQIMIFMKSLTIPIICQWWKNKRVPKKLESASLFCWLWFAKIGPT